MAFVGLFIAIIGVLFLYAAVKNQSPITIVKSALGG